MKLQLALPQIDFSSVSGFCNLYSSQQNISSSPSLQNFKQCISWFMFFAVWYLPRASRVHNKSRNVACQCTVSL